MYPPQKLIEDCHQLFHKNDVAGKWSGSKIQVDYDVLTNEVIRHYHASPGLFLETIIINFIRDYPIIQQLSRSPEIQRRLDDYLNKVTAKKFSNLPPLLEPREIVQEAMARIFKNIDKFRYESKFFTWCTTILIRTGYELIRRERRRTQHERISLDNPVSTDDGDASLHEVIASDMPDEEQLYRIREIFRLIDEVLEKSKNRSRDEKIIYQRLEGVSAKCIAEEMGTTVETVNMLKHRVKIRLIARGWEEENKKPPPSKKTRGSKEKKKETSSL